MRRSRIAAIAATACCLAAQPARAEPPQISLTQEKKPSSTPWSDPAQFSYSIVNGGKDSANIQVNAALNWYLQAGEREIAIAPFAIVNRNTQSDARQNNVEIGTRIGLGYDTSAMQIDGPVGSSPVPVPEGASTFNYRAQLDLSYARTAAYPDLGSAVCTATPTLRQCMTQHKESLRAVAAVVPYFPHAEGMAGARLAYSIAPLFDIAYDHLLDNKVNTTTGIVERGGYLSANAGLSVQLSPSFIDPAFVFKIAGQVRPRLAASSTRRAGIEKWPGLLTVSASYFFINPPSEVEEPAWRAGVGVSYSEGSDPLNGKPDQSVILLSFVLGRY